MSSLKRDYEIAKMDQTSSMIVIEVHFDKKMIYYELAIIVGLFVLALVAIAAFGRPMAEAYAEKMKIEAKEIGSDKSVKLECRINELESQVNSLNQQVLTLQESLDFTMKLVDKGDSAKILKTKQKDVAK